MPEPLTLDPTIGYDEDSYAIIKQIFSGLVELGADYEIIPDVAHSWEISEDGHRYRFFLRDGITWSDGEPVRAADFEYAWKRILDPANDAPQAQALASSLYDIKGARAYHLGEISDPGQVGTRAIDALTLEVELEAPASYFLNMLTTLYPVPSHIVEAYGLAWTARDNLVSNGPFLLASYRPGESLTLTRNPTYHGRFPGNLEAVEVTLNLPDIEALAIYEANGADTVGLGVETYSARQRYVEEYHSFNHPSTTYLSFNNSRPPLDDLRVRQAFVLAVDRDRLAGEEGDGISHSASGGLVPPGIPGHSPGIGLAYDPEKARQLLAQAGYPDGRDFPELELVVPTGIKKIGKYLTAQWRHHLNVEVRSVEVEWEKFSEIRHRRGDLFYSGWSADYPDPDIYLRVCVRAIIPYWRNKSYDRTLDRARRTTSQVERMRLYKAADKILIEEAVMMPLLYLRWHVLVKPWVQVPRNYVVYNFKDVILEPH